MTVTSKRQPISKDAVVEMFLFSGLSSRDIASTFGVTRRRVNQICRGVKRVVPVPYKHSYRRGYFSTIDTEEKAYWLGFLLGDGSATPRAISVLLVKEDMEHLTRFALDIDSDARPVIVTSPSLEKYDNDYCRLSICNKDLADELSTLGVVPNKTLTASLPLDKVPQELWRHLVRGVFDADGCIGLYKKKVSRPTWNPDVPVVHLCGSPKMVFTVHHVFSHDLGENLPVYPKKRSYHFIETRGWGKGLAVLDYLYKDCSISLPRKQAKYEHILSRKPDTPARRWGKPKSKELS